MSVNVPHFRAFFALLALRPEFVAPRVLPGPLKDRASQRRPERGKRTLMGRPLHLEQPTDAVHTGGPRVLSTSRHHLHVPHLDVRGRLQRSVLQAAALRIHLSRGPRSRRSLNGQGRLSADTGRPVMGSGGPRKSARRRAWTSSKDRPAQARFRAARLPRTLSANGPDRAVQS